MNRLSEDGKTTILKWDTGEIRWRDRDGDTGELCAGDTSTGPTVCARVHVYVPPEALRWLNGERTPPPEPIAVGDEVVWGNGSAVWTVVAVHDECAWVRTDSDFGGRIQLRAELRRVSDG